MVQPLSISQHGRSEPFYLQVARGLVQGHRIVIRSGLNPDIDNGAQESLWDHNGVQTTPAAATIVTVSSTSGSDTAAGVGARTVLVAGLDSLYNEIQEVVALNGTAAVSTVNSYLKIHSCSVLSVGSSATAVGDIYVGEGTVTAGIPAAVYAKIRIGWNTTQMMQYTIPAGWTAYLLDITGSAIASATNQYTLLSIRSQANATAPWYKGGSVVVSGGIMFLNFEAPRAFAEKSTFDVVADTTDSNVIVGVTCRFLLVQNDVVQNVFGAVQ